MPLAELIVRIMEVLIQGVVVDDENVADVLQIVEEEVDRFVKELSAILTPYFGRWIQEQRRLRQAAIIPGRGLSSLALAGG